jgi:hypothetical protein
MNPANEGRFAVRIEPIAILFSFFAAAALMDRLYAQVGYVRLLGLAHLVCWGSVWLWIVSRRSAIGTASVFGRYIHFYLVVAAASLSIDALDVIHCGIGDGELLNRWS